MDTKNKALAMIDIAEIILRENNGPMNLQSLISSVMKIKEISEDNFEQMAQLYMDITTSAKFVFAGDDNWDLKERNLELWDKDGYFFIKPEEIEDIEDDDLDITDFTIDDVDRTTELDDEDEELDDDLDEDIKEEMEYIDVELPVKSTDEDDDDDIEIEFDDDYDEDDYNDIMDDYEDMYDE